MLTVMLCVQNTNKQNTDNSHRLVVSTEIILCVQDTDNSYRHVVCAEHRQFQRSRCMCRTQTILTAMLRVQNTDKQNTDNSNRLVVSTENRQFSPSSCVCSTQTNRTQTILTVILCVQNTVGRWCGHVHQLCRRLRVVTVAPAQSAVPAQSVALLPIGQSVLTHHVLSGTRMDRR